MRAYVVERFNVFHDWSKRVGPLHKTVFHGVGYYPTLAAWKSVPGVNETGERIVTTRPPDWRWPAVTNGNRDPLHIARSGCFVPPVFGSSFVFIVVSPEVREALSTLPKIAFNSVVLEQLVDLPMPKLGDFSWFQRKDLEQYENDPDNLLKSLPHDPKYEQKVSEYCQLLPANLQDVVNKYADVISMPVDFGSYAYRSRPTEVPVSQALLKEYPIVQTPHLVFREDAFARIAPFLDLDYYAIAVLTLGE